MLSAGSPASPPGCVCAEPPAALSNLSLCAEGRRPWGLNTRGSLKSFECFNGRT